MVEIIGWIAIFAFGSYLSFMFGFFIGTSFGLCGLEDLPTAFALGVACLIGFWIFFVRMSPLSIGWA